MRCPNTHKSIGRRCYSYFVDKETEASRCQTSWVRLGDQYVMKCVLEPTLSWCSGADLTVLAVSVRTFLKEENSLF